MHSNKIKDKDSLTLSCLELLHVRERYNCHNSWADHQTTLEPCHAHLADHHRPAHVEITNRRGEAPQWASKLAPRSLRSVGVK